MKVVQDICYINNILSVTQSDAFLFPMAQQKLILSFCKQPAGPERC